jgi:hypothetical protein
MIIETLPSSAFDFPALRWPVAVLLFMSKSVRWRAIHPLNDVPSYLFD